MNTEMNGDGSTVKTKKNEQVEKVLQPFYHITQSPRTHFTAKFVLAFNYWLKIPDDKLHAVEEIVNMFVNSVLLVDDIIDYSSLRRGVPVAHSIYGLASTINASNYVMIQTIKRVRSLNHPDATSVFTKLMLELYRGQGMDVYWRDNSECPLEEDYKVMTDAKARAPLMLMISLMQLFSDNKDDYNKLVGFIGLYWQIQNDYCSLWNKETFDNNGFCEDLTEGKFGFPILHAINSKPEDRQIINILRQRTRDIEMKRYCVTLIEGCGSKTYTQEKLDQLERDMRAELSRFEENPLLAAFINKLASYYKN